MAQALVRKALLSLCEVGTAVLVTDGSTKVGNTAATTDSGASTMPSIFLENLTPPNRKKKNYVGVAALHPSFSSFISSAAHLFAVKDVALADAEAICESIHDGV